MTHLEKCAVFRKYLTLSWILGEVQTFDTSNSLLKMFPGKRQTWNKKNYYKFEFTQGYLNKIFNKINSLTLSENSLISLTSLRVIFTFFQSKTVCLNIGNTISNQNVYFKTKVFALVFQYRVFISLTEI